MSVVKVKVGKEGEGVPGKLWEGMEGDLGIGCDTRDTGMEGSSGQAGGDS